MKLQTAFTEPLQAQQAIQNHALNFTMPPKAEQRSGASNYEALLKDVENLLNSLPAAPEKVRELPRNWKQGLFLSTLGFSIMATGLVGKKVMDAYKETKQYSWLPLIPAELMGFQLLLFRALPAFSNRHLPRASGDKLLMEHLNEFGLVVPELREALQHLQYTLKHAERDQDSPIDEAALRAIEARHTLILKSINILKKESLEKNPMRLKETPKAFYNKMGLGDRWQDEHHAGKPKKNWITALFTGDTFLSRWWLDGLGRLFDEHRATHHDVLKAAAWQHEAEVKQNAGNTEGALHRLAIDGHPYGFGHVGLWPQGLPRDLWRKTLNSNDSKP